MPKPVPAANRAAEAVKIARSIEAAAKPQTALAAIRAGHSYADFKATCAMPLSAKEAFARNQGRNSSSAPAPQTATAPLSAKEVFARNAGRASKK